MRLVVLESPFAGSTEAERAQNLAYARAALLDCLLRGEAPFASHLLFPQVLNDGNVEERARGIQAGFAWAEAAESFFEYCPDSGDHRPLRAVYTDLGISRGMQAGVEHAQKIGQCIEYRTIPGWTKA